VQGLTVAYLKELDMGIIGSKQVSPAFLGRSAFLYMSVLFLQRTARIKHSLTGADLVRKFVQVSTQRRLILRGPACCVRWTEHPC